MTTLAGGGAPGRPQLIRAMNERLMLEHVRRANGISRADLARISSLSKNTVSLALAALERAGLVRATGVRSGLPGPAALLYELHPDAAFVLALDVGRNFLRGAISDFTGAVRAKASVRARGTSAASRLAQLVQLADMLCTEVGVKRGDLTQTVLGSPGIYDPQRDALVLAGALPGWNKPSVLAELRRAFGPAFAVENDVDAAALAERAHGHGRGVESFAFVSVGSGIGMGLVMNGRLHRGAHRAAGEIGYLPVDRGRGMDARDARKRGSFEAAASAAGIVRAARAAGLAGPVTARYVFDAAQRGDRRAARVVAQEALLVARAICAVVTVVDPDLVVLGGGVGQAAGFLDAVAQQLRTIAPVLPELRVSALGVDAVVDGCLSAGMDRVWDLVTATAVVPENPDGAGARR
ncbi:MAG: ROK family protein [Micromonosporaceae bacterium]|nr:ROK family protein [Micromonosporaceae bacterium]